MLFLPFEQYREGRIGNDYTSYHLNFFSIQLTGAGSFEVTTFFEYCLLANKIIGLSTASKDDVLSLIYANEARSNYVW